MTGRRARRRQGGRSLSFTPGTTYDLGPVDPSPKNGAQRRPLFDTFTRSPGLWPPPWVERRRPEPPPADQSWLRVEPSRPPRDRAGWWALCGFLAGFGTGALAATGVILR